MTPEKREELFKQFSSNKTDINKIIGFGAMLEQMDVSKRFKADSLFFPIMNELYSNNGYRTMRIPLIIADVNLSYINDETFNNVFLKHVGSQPFDELTKEQIQHQNISFSGLFVDSLVNNHIQIYWNREMFLSNTRKAVDRVQLIIRKDTFDLAENTYFELDNFYSSSVPLTQLKINVTFSDGSTSLSENDVFFLNIPKKKNSLRLMNLRQKQVIIFHGV